MDRITCLFKDYLDRGYQLPPNLNTFEKLNIDGNTYDIKEMFKQRNLYKEIGSETEELFYHNLETLVNEALVKFNPSLKMLNDNYQNLFKRIQEETTTGNTSSNGQNENYLQPVNSTANKMSDMSKSSGTGQYSETKTRQFAWLKSNPEILKASQEIHIEIYAILTYLDKAFIGEY